MSLYLSIHTRLDSDIRIAYLAQLQVAGLRKKERATINLLFPYAGSWWNMNNPLQTKTIDITDAPELIDLEKPEQGLEMHIGSNIFRNTNGVLKLQGKEQLVLETQLDPLMLLLTMDLYDEQGARVGHIRRNALSAHSKGRFTINVTTSDETATGTPPSVTVAERTGHTVFEACLIQRRKIRITVGHFHTHKGDLVAVSPHYCRIGTGLTLFGHVAESRGSAVIIG